MTVPPGGAGGALERGDHDGQRLDQAGGDVLQPYQDSVRGWSGTAAVREAPVDAPARGPLVRAQVGQAPTAQVAAGAGQRVRLSHTTRSPTDQSSMPSPSSRTVPMNSWPSVTGGQLGTRPPRCAGRYRRSRRSRRRAPPTPALPAGRGPRRGAGRARRRRACAAPSSSSGEPLRLPDQDLEADAAAQVGDRGRRLVQGDRAGQERLGSNLPLATRSVATARSPRE